MAKRTETMNPKIQHDLTEFEKSLKDPNVKITSCFCEVKKPLIPRIRLRLLRHKEVNYNHGCWLLMFQNHWPLIRFKYTPKEYDEINKLLGGFNRTSFDVILEYYEKNGGCGKTIWRII